MNTKTLKIPNLFSQLIDLETKNTDQDFEIISLDQIPECKRPVEDFRVLAENLTTIEETMVQKAKTLNQKKNLLTTWEKLEKLVHEMCERLKKDIAKSQVIEEKMEAAREQARLLQIKSGIYNRFN